MPDALATEEEAVDELRAWVKQRVGIAFDETQRAALRSRVRALCPSNDAPVVSLVSRLRGGDAVLAQRVVDAVSTNHTFLFREGETFDYLRATIAPVLPVQSGGVRIWSAAASSGEEAYSIAATLAGVYGPAAARLVQILGTDISERQIRTAEKAIYRGDRSAMHESVRSFFEPAGDGMVRVRADVASMCTFRRMNLAQFPWPFTQGFDVIFLRNVLYYFDTPLRARVVEHCYAAAKHGAWLITSHTEPTFDIKTQWRWVMPGVYRKGGL